MVRSLTTILALLLLSGCSGISLPAALPSGGATVAAGVTVQNDGWRFLTSWFHLQAATGKATNVNHYTYKLYTYPAHVLKATYTSTGLTTAFTTVPNGTYNMTAEAFFSTDDSVTATKLGAQTSSNQVTVASPTVTYTSGNALMADLNLVDGTGGIANNAVTVSYLGNSVTPNHYTYKLYDSGNNLKATGTSSNTSTSFTGLPDGSYKVTVEGFSSADDSTSITLGTNNPTLNGPQTSGTFAVAGNSVSFPVNLSLFINTWTTKTALPAANWQFAAAAVGTKIYTLGGLAGTTTTRAYDTATNTWALKAAIPSGIRNACAAVIGTTIYTFGNNPSSGLVLAYDTVNNTWSTKTAMPTARTDAAAAVVNGKIYVIGGTNGSFLATNEMYDPATDTWTTGLKPMPTPRYIHGAAAINNKIYCVAGLGSAGTYPTEVYDPATDTWTTKAPLLSQRNGHATAVVNGRIYLLSGSNSSSVVTSSVDMYDPSRDVWYNMANIGTPVWRTGCDTVGNKIYVLGGFNSGAQTLNQVFSP